MDQNQRLLLLSLRRHHAIADLTLIELCKQQDRALIPVFTDEFDMAVLQLWLAECKWPGGIDSIGSALFEALPAIRSGHRLFQPLGLIATVTDA